MHNRTRMIAAAATACVAFAAGSAAAVASTTGGKPTAPATAKSAEERQGHAAITAAVAQALHVSAVQVSVALRPLFAAGRAEASSAVVSQTVCQRDPRSPSCSCARCGYR